MNCVINDKGKKSLARAPSDTKKGAAGLP